MDLWRLWDVVTGKLGATFLSAGSGFSVFSLAAALAIAVAFTAGKRMRSGKPVRWRVLARALSRTHRPRPTFVADLGFFAFNLFAAGILIGWAVLSHATVAQATAGALAGAFGERGPTGLPELASRALITLGVFLAYELGYWLDHYVSHKVPFFWDFHRVHHSAEVLTPWTVWRVHPIESLKFANILALFTGAASGLGTWAFGAGLSAYSINGANLILLAFAYTVVHLQHTHVWIPFGGWLGRLLQSPAHHQIHHSSDPKHFDKNLGSCLAIWDWAFGTLYVPARTPEKLRFGVHAHKAEEHSVTELLVRPFVRSGRRVVRGLRGGRDARRRIVTAP